MNIVGKKNWYFAISMVVMVPGIISLILFGLRPGIDFSGGSRMEYQISSIKNKISNDTIKSIFKKNEIEVVSIQSFGKDKYIIRTKPLDQKTYSRIKKSVKQQFPGTKEVSFETIGPTIGQEITLNAFKSVIMASVLIVFYIAWSFRRVPKPASSWRFGFCAIVALVHDVLVLVGIFSLLGHFYAVEIDSLFVTAVLTVIGFSVHDTIVVFDRIRENLRRMAGMSFSDVVNASILQTFNRSLNTSLTVILVLFTLLLFGGESIRWFVVALLIGIISGTYSSIFNASPLLVVWEEWSRKRNKSLLP